MKQVILDTNFIINCVKQKIDFFDDLKLRGFQIIIPKQVINELKKNKAELALKVLEKHKGFFKIIIFKKSYVDKRIIEFAEKNPKAIIATLDKDLKNRIINQKLVIREKKRLEII